MTRSLRPLFALGLCLTAPAFAQPVHPATPAVRRPQVPAARPVVAPAVPPVAAPVVVAQPSQTPPPGPPPGQNVQVGQNANGALTATQIAERIQAFYDRTTDFQADFTQVSRNQLYGREERRSGHVMFRRPGRMRWNYALPSGDLIVSDGTTVWAYQSDDRQAVQQNLAQSQLPTALTFLAGTGRITDQFSFRSLDANQFRFPDGYVLELRPLVPAPSYERIVFYIDRTTFQVVRTVVINAQGNQNRFDFTSPQVNMNIPDTTFRWTPPPGTSVVRP